MMDSLDREAREKKSALKNLFEFAARLGDSGVSKEWMERALKAWFESFEFFGSRSLSPEFVVEIGPVWFALGDKEFEVMLKAWLEDPSSLSLLAEKYKSTPVSLSEAVDAFLLRTLVLYETTSSNATSQRYEAERQAEGDKIVQLLWGFSTWTESCAFQRDLALVSGERCEQLFEQFRKRPSWAIDPEVDPASIHRRILAQCAECFPMNQIARLYSNGVRDRLGTEGDDDVSVKMRAVLSHADREVRLRYGREVIAAFRTPKGLVPMLKSEQHEVYQQSLTEPNKWFFGDNVDLFQDIVTESQQNEHIRDQMWRILRTILPEQDESLNAFSELFNEYPKFVKGIWSGTHLELLNPGYRNAVLKRRDRVKELVPSIAEELPYIEAPRST